MRSALVCFLTEVSDTAIDGAEACLDDVGGAGVGLDGAEACLEGVDALLGGDVAGAGVGSGGGTANLGGLASKDSCRG